jgi:hypothetical protein
MLWPTETIHDHLKDNLDSIKTVRFPKTIFSLYLPLTRKILRTRQMHHSHNCSQGAFSHKIAHKGLFNQQVALDPLPHFKDKIRKMWEIEQITNFATGPMNAFCKVLANLKLPNLSPALHLRKE